ncbi:GIY-YIG nuclease family protein [Candidatus Gracilibacteria bacterium]|nr:GIY-YIG nuclease family protein [Candidatus Gracilibacteria bacterium]
MIRGKTINIFVPDSNPRGIKICDIKDSIVKAIFIPRNKLDDIAKRTDVSEPGIYFLFGKEDEIGKPRVYIGEAENLLKRIKQHNRDINKDFWTTAIGFVSEKKNINKAHIKYLENYCCNKAKEINKYELENDTTPTQPSLTEQDVDFVLSFFDDLKILIATLGFSIFEKNKKEKQNLFICKGKKAYAEGEYAEDGMIVFKGAKSNFEEATSANEWVKNIRDLLLEKRVMHLENDVYVFDEDYTFSSPSSAAVALLGRSANGWTEWKDKKGKTLSERFRKS